MGTDPLSQLSLRAADSQAGEATEGALVPYSVVHVLPPLKSALVVGPIDEEGQVFRSRYRPPPAQSPLLVRLGVVEDLNPQSLGYDLHVFHQNGPSKKASSCFFALEHTPSRLRGFRYIAILDREKLEVGGWRQRHAPVSCP